MKHVILQLSELMMFVPIYFYSPRYCFATFSSYLLVSHNFLRDLISSWVSNTYLAEGSVSAGRVENQDNQIHVQNRKSKSH